MAARLSALLPTLAALTVVWILTASPIPFATAARPPQKPAPVAKRAPKGAPVLVVPDVRRQAYVFAKGILEENGFAWRVKGAVQGYAANVVASQKPEPGTRVVDNGLPTVTLRLERNPDYAERGLPENRSPHAGSPVVFADPRPAPTPASALPRWPGAASLPQRAQLLAERLARSAEPTRALVRDWLREHAWIVAGANAGRPGSAQALRMLIRIDRSLQRRWGIGARSEAVARAALARVERASR